MTGTIFILIFIGTIFAFLGFMFVMDNPEILPGHAKRAAKKRAKHAAKLLENDRKEYKDITPLAVSMGYPDLRPMQGWYGFSVEGRRGVAYLGGQRFGGSSVYGAVPAQQIIDGVLREIESEMKSHLKRLERDRQLEQMVNGNAIIGDRKPWVED